MIQHYAQLQVSLFFPKRDESIGKNLQIIRIPIRMFDSFMLYLIDAKFRLRLFVLGKQSNKN